MKIAFLFIPFLIVVSGEALIESRVDEKYPQQLAEGPKADSPATEEAGRSPS